WFLIDDGFSEGARKLAPLGACRTGDAELAQLVPRVVHLPFRDIELPCPVERVRLHRVDTESDIVIFPGKRLAPLPVMQPSERTERARIGGIGDDRFLKQPLRAAGIAPRGG